MNPKFDSQNPYHVLGLKSNAAKASIKKAYRNLMNEHHPDKGGDTDTFKKIQEAYNILKDPEKKAYFDEHGARPAGKRNIMAEQLLIQMFNTWVTSTIDKLRQNNRSTFIQFADEEYLNEKLVPHMIEQFELAVEDTEKKIKSLKDDLDSLHKIAERCGGGFLEVMEGKIEAIEGIIKNDAEAHLQAQLAAIEMLKDGSWTYRYDEPEELNGTLSSIGQHMRFLMGE